MFLTIYFNDIKIVQVEGLISNSNRSQERVIGLKEFLVFWWRLAIGNWPLNLHPPSLILEQVTVRNKQYIRVNFYFSVISVIYVDIHSLRLCWKR